MELLDRNLSFLASVQPQLATKFRDYQPVKVTKASTGNKDILVNGEPFYGMDADTACAAQVAHYLQSPNHFCLSYSSGESHFGQHQNVINALNIKAKSLGYPLKQPHNTSMVVLGSGIGFVLNHLIEHQQLRYLLLVEPDDDMLYQFLCNTDLQLLSTHCEANNGAFTILQPQDLNHFKTQVADIATAVGYQLFSEMGFYRHYETALFNAIFDNIKAIRHQWLSTWGFFDDEIFGLRHTLANSQNNPLLFEAKPEKSSTQPVLIVGNGPSLDQDIARLKAHQDKFLIVSCGTALPALLRNGIRPDIHAEMERMKDVFETLEPWFDHELLQNTTFLGLNTVHPKVVNAFKSSLLFAKANDIGTKVLQEANYSSPEPLYYCNPTVTNLATSALSKMGYHNLILLGCDYGYRDVNQHHASSSDYFDKNSSLATASYQNELQVEGNFGGYVATERLYNVSRHTMERMLEVTEKLQCINCSDGAMIKGAKPERFADVIKGLNTKTKAQLDKTQFKPIELNPDRLKDYLQPAKAFIEKFATTVGQCKNLVEIQKLFSEVSQQLDKLKTDTPLFLLFSGVMRYFSITISGHTGRMPGNHHAAYCDFAVKEMQKFCKHCSNTLTQLLTN